MGSLSQLKGGSAAAPESSASVASSRRPTIAAIGAGEKRGGWRGVRGERVAAVQLNARHPSPLAQSYPPGGWEWGTVVASGRRGQGGGPASTRLLLEDNFFITCQFTNNEACLPRSATPPIEMLATTCRKPKH